MAQITTRETAGTGAIVAGVPLTNAQIDQNFINLNVDVIGHKYHSFSNDQYFFDDYEQGRYFRLFTENAVSDNTRFGAIQDVEYWNGTAWVAWSDVGSLIKNLLDGRQDTYCSIDHVHRRFRFTVTKNSGWPTKTIIALQTTWTGFTYTSATVTIEGSTQVSGGTWTTRDTSVFGNATSGANWGIHAKVTSSLHTGEVYNRVTIDITDWVDSGGYTTYPLVGFAIYSNYSGSALEPWSWNYDKVVNFQAIPTALGNTLLTSSNYSTYALPISGGTLTGLLTVPSQLTIQAQGGTEGGELILKKGTGQTGVSGDLIIDYQGNTVRFFENGGSTRQFLFDLTNGNITGQNGILANINGNAATATTWQTARTITIGGTGKSINGSANVSWTLAEIGAYASSNPSGYITSSSNITGSAANLSGEDNRTISPSELTAGQLKFGFTSWNNNNTTPYADFLHLRSYTDSSGGLDNLVMFRKDAIGIRVWQQTYGSSTAYSTYKDVAFTDGTGASGTWGISITGNAATVTNGVYTTGSYADPAWITSLAKSKVGLSNVENTALSTWAGSTNVTTVGAITPTSVTSSGGITTSSATHRVQLGTDAGGSISIGRIDNVTSAPYIDFNSGATSTDFDVRLASTGGNGTAGNGLLTITGNVNIAKNLTVVGTVQHAGLTMSAGTGIDQVYSVTDTLTLTTSWQDTTVNAAELATGTYVVQVRADDFAVGGGQYNTYYSGVMSWTALDTNETSSDEIVLHRAGHASNTGNLYLRVLRTATADVANLKLQIAGSTANTGASNYEFKFRRLI